MRPLKPNAQIAGGEQEYAAAKAFDESGFTGYCNRLQISLPPMNTKAGINWTNKSALAIANGANPVAAVQDAARALVLKARELGWEGPPFNPVKIVELLNAKVSANSNIADARLIATDHGPIIEFNPQQPRERVRFSIAHELAHLLFPDWPDEIRNRSVIHEPSDNWQLEMLCNIAASEFVLPIGSLPSSFHIASIEKLMQERRRYDVSTEAFLIRLAKVSDMPVSVFFASPIEAENGSRQYRVDYSVSSAFAPPAQVEGTIVPQTSALRNCTAIGHTDQATETWFGGEETLIEYVGIPGYPGSRYPRVAGIVRFGSKQSDKRPIRYVHGNVIAPLDDGRKIICQLVNDRAVKWGGGVARKFAQKFPDAEAQFSQNMIDIKPSERLGNAIFTQLNAEDILASIIAQEGFGPSMFSRLRYSALQSGLRVIASMASKTGASIHMPRIGTGAAGGDWGVIEEMIEEEMVRLNLTVTVYDLPPRREQFELIS